MTFTLHQGDCIEVMRAMPDNSVDAVVTDPPYGIRFMGKAWDGADIEARYATAAATDEGRRRNGMAMQAGRNDRSKTANMVFQQFSEDWAAEAQRVLKPGGYLLSFSAARTYHRMVCGIEDAGFEIRDCIQWIFGSGFPKSHNLDGDRKGWGTALKPAHEPIVVARKPLQIGYTVAANVLAHGTGALNIDGCRVAGEKGSGNWAGVGGTAGKLYEGGFSKDEPSEQNFAGRWPANIIHDGSPEVLAGFPESSITGARTDRSKAADVAGTNWLSANHESTEYTDSGSAARFFYCAKASREDRNEGLPQGVAPAVAQNATMRERETADWPTRNGNHHPTVKPTDLMAYLCRLVTPPGGTVLDPFMGSGSTGKAAVLEGFNFIGIDLSPEYVAIARARIDHAQRQGHQPSLLEAA